MYPIKKPTVGLDIIAMPPRPPASTGNPSSARSRNRIILNTPMGPRIEPAKKTDIFCKIIGTGTAGITRLGKSPNIYISAVKKDMSTMFLIEI